MIIDYYKNNEVLRTVVAVNKLTRNKTIKSAIDYYRSNEEANSLDLK